MVLPFFSSIVFGIANIGWIPLPIEVPVQIRTWMLVFGALLYFPGMALALWGRLVLGRNYFVSTGFGARLFAGHRLITHGPFALVRHPMYAGLMLAALGALLLYATWTTLFFVCVSPLLVTRAFREEEVLAAEFGSQWQDYCHRVSNVYSTSQTIIDIKPCCCPATL